MDYPVVGSISIEEDTKTAWIYNGREWVRVDKDVALWCFEYMYHMDKANACMHCAPVKFSPITFRLAVYLIDEWEKVGSILTQELEEVKSHIGTYDLDPGR